MPLKSQELPRRSLRQAGYSPEHVSVFQTSAHSNETLSVGHNIPHQASTWIPPPQPSVQQVQLECNAMSHDREHSFNSVHDMAPTLPPTSNPNNLNVRNDTSTHSSGHDMLHPMNVSSPTLLEENIQTLSKQALNQGCRRNHPTRNNFTTSFNPGGL